MATRFRRIEFEGSFSGARRVMGQDRRYSTRSLMSRNACSGENGEKSSEGWRFKLDTKSDPLESGDVDDNGDLSKNGEFGTNAKKSLGPLESGDLAKMATLAKMAKKRQRVAISSMCKYNSNRIQKYDYNYHNNSKVALQGEFQ